MDDGQDNVVDLFGRVDAPKTEFYCDECSNCGQKSFLNYIMESDENLYMCSICTFCSEHSEVFWIRAEGNPLLKEE